MWNLYTAFIFDFIPKIENIFFSSTSHRPNNFEYTGHDKYTYAQAFFICKCVFE